MFTVWFHQARPTASGALVSNLGPREPYESDWAWGPCRGSDLRWRDYLGWAYDAVGFSWGGEQSAHLSRPGSNRDQCSHGALVCRGHWFCLHLVAPKRRPIFYVLRCSGWRNVRDHGANAPRDRKHEFPDSILVFAGHPASFLGDTERRPGNLGCPPWLGCGVDSDDRNAGGAA